MNDAPESVLSPLNPAFDRRTEDASASPARDVDLESEVSPEPEDRPGRSGDHEMTERQSLRSSWSDHCAASSSLEQSASPHGHAELEPNPSTHLPPLSTHQHSTERDSQTQLPLYVDSPTVYYQSAPAIPDPRPPTLADAEEAINTVITYLDTTGMGLIDHSERLVLNTIKCALFQAGSGIPFDRNSH